VRVVESIILTRKRRACPVLSHEMEVVRRRRIVVLIQLPRPERRRRQELRLRTLPTFLVPRRSPQLLRLLLTEVASFLLELQLPTSLLCLDRPRTLSPPQLQSVALLRKPPRLRPAKSAAVMLMTTTVMVHQVPSSERGSLVAGWGSSCFIDWGSSFIVLHFTICFGSNYFRLSIQVVVSRRHTFRLKVITTGR
jgi:hypothetical protein